MIDQVAINGIPLILIVFGLVEICKRFGIRGDWLTAASVFLGVLLYVAYSLTQSGSPASVGGWLAVIVTGLAYGLTASGVYDFVDARIKKSE